MGKNKKIAKKNKVSAWAVVTLVVITLIGLTVSIIGTIRFFNKDITYEKDIINCDDKDYSSYVKVKETQSLGNEYLNNQINIYKTAIQNATAAGDYNAVDQLMEEYNKLLVAQSQTKTTNKTYDYSEADKAKDKCYSLADKERETSFVVGIICLSVGVAMMLVGLGVLCYTLSRAKKH